MIYTFLRKTNSVERREGNKNKIDLWLAAIIKEIPMFNWN
jgi:hypothetical protein